MISSTANPRVKWIRALQKSRRERWEHRQFVVEGLRLVSEAIKARHPIHMVLCTADLQLQKNELLDDLAHLGAEMQLVSESVLKACSDTENPAGVLAVVPFPKPFIADSPDLVLVVDHLADPGNLGTLLRTALAAGVQATFLVEGTVDLFNPKVVRAGMGAHFYLPVMNANEEDLFERLPALELWLAEKGKGVAYDQVDWRKPCGLIIGSEAHGAKQHLRARVERRVQIPMKGPVESLNASIAAGIILFEIVRQREAR